MYLLNKVKIDHTEARKAKNDNISSVLGLLVGEIENETKKSGNKDINTITLDKIKSISKGLREVVDHARSDEEFAKNLEQLEFLEKYLPKMMTRDELEEFIKNSGFTTMKDVMQLLKSEKPNQYDGKMASQIVKEMIQ